MAEHELADFDPESGHLHSCGKETGSQECDCAAFLYCVAQDYDYRPLAVLRKLCITDGYVECLDTVDDAEWLLILDSQAIVTTAEKELIELLKSNQLPTAKGID